MDRLTSDFTNCYGPIWKSCLEALSNSDLKSSEYATPVLGLIFLKFADNKYKRAEPDITKEFSELRGTRREKPISEIAIRKCGFYLPDHARYHYLLGLPEQEDLARKIKQAMEAIEEYKPELDGILPKDEYFALTRTSNTLLVELLKNFSRIPADANGDIFGKIYEFFLAGISGLTGFSRCTASMCWIAIPRSRKS